MKSITTTVISLLIAGITFSQHSNGGITTHNANISVSHTTQSTNNVHYSTPNISTNTYSTANNSSNFTTTTNYNRPSTDNNNYNGGSYYNSNNNNNNNNGGSNYNSNSNNYNGSSNYNSYNNSYNNNYGGYNNGYSSYNNSTYNNSTYRTYDTKQSYTTRDENYGERTISEDQGKMSPKSNPYNTSKMMSNYRNNTAIEKFFKQNQKPSQVFIINAQQENTLKGTGGTVVKIAPNSFVDKNGEVIKGDVEFEMKEMYSKSEMIFSNAHTVCNDQVLKSGGEIFLGAERNGEALTLAPGKEISVEFPTKPTDEPMQLFNGQPNNSSVNWNLASPNVVTPVANSNSSTGYSYNFTSPNMNWLNCDQFTRRTNQNNALVIPTTKVNVRLPNRYDSTNTAVFLVYTGQNSITKFDGFSTYDGTNRMKVDQNAFDTKWYSVQEGVEVTIVAISEINGQYYSSMEPTRIQKNHTADLVMNPTTLDKFKTDMENLR